MFLGLDEKFIAFLLQIFLWNFLVILLKLDFLCLLVLHLFKHLPHMLITQ
jgi:hypothetical protein